MKSGAKSLWVLLIRIAIAFIAISFTASEMAFANEDVDYWAQTGLSEKNLRNYLTQDRCYKNENSFLGCIAAINSLLSSSTPAKILTNKQIESIPGANEVVQIIEGLKIQNYKLDIDKKKSFIDTWKEASKTRDDINKSWKQLYSLTNSKQLSFDALITAALAKPNSNKQQARLADALNQYFQTNYDPHTYIASKAEFSKRLSTTEESFSGIGSMLQFVEGQLIMTPLEGSPAQKAGIRYLDVLTAVDGKPIRDISLKDVADKMVKGPENTIVALTIQRDSQTLDIKVTRGKITIKNIDGKIISDDKFHTKIGYIKINSFMETGLCKKFVSLAKDLKQAGAQSLVLDLRENGGGLVDEALCMATYYIGGNQVMLTTQNPETNKVTQSIQNSSAGAGLYALFGNKPLVFILNARSASASELLPGSIQSYSRSIIVGEKSFGKGTMQSTLNTTAIGLQDIPGVQLMGTIARFHFASGESNQLVGIAPDFLAYSKPNPTEKDKFALREADLFPNAIHPGEAPTGISSEAKNKISKCIQKRNQIESSYAAELNTALGPDYQLITAREVAACL